MDHPQEGFRSAARVRSALANAAVFRVLSQISGAVIYVLLVRIMTEHDYGVYNLFYSIPAVMGALLSLGIGNALLRYLPEYFASKNYALARHFVSWSLRLRLATSATFLLLCLLFWEQIAPIFEVEQYKTYFLIFIAITLTHFQARLLTLVLGANLMQQWSSGLAALFSLLKLFGYLAVMYVGVSISSILIADLVAYLLWYGSLRFIYYTRIPRPEVPKKTKFPPDERKRVFRYAAFYNFNDVGVITLSSTADRLFIAAFMSPIAVGAYAFCTGLNIMIQKLMPVAFFNGVIEPMVFTLDRQAHKGRARGYFKFLVKMSYLVQFPILVLVAAVPAQIINVVFAGKFLEYEYLLIAAFAFPALYAYQRPVAIMAQWAERAGIILASKIFAAYNVVAAIALIPLFGAYGAIAATGSAQLFKNIFIWFFVRDVASFRGTGAFFLIQIALWAICWALIRLTTAEMNNALGLITAVTIVGLFSLLGLRLALFDDRESKLIEKISGTRAAQLLKASGVIRI